MGEDISILHAQITLDSTTALLASTQIFIREESAF